MSKTTIGAGNMYAGFAFVSALSLVSLFAVGGILKRVPGLRAFL